MAGSLKLLLELTKFRIAVMSMLSTAAGYIAAGEAVQWNLAGSLLGTLILACGTLALNQWQEQDVDALMDRTKNRPIPSKRISSRGAFIVSALLLSAGTAALWFLAGEIPAALGWVSVIWYNGIYTPLKRRTAFAVVPGSVIGAIPPAIGWTAAGGSLSSPAILAIAFFFFVWQVPHFWLLLFKYGRQYEQAKLASLTAVFSMRQMTRLTFIWICASAVSCLLLPLFGAVYSGWTTILLFASGVYLVLTSSRLLKPGQSESLFRSAFRAINVHALLVMLLLSIDRIVRT